MARRGFVRHGVGLEEKEVLNQPHLNFQWGTFPLQTMLVLREDLYFMVKTGKGFTD